MYRSGMSDFDYGMVAGARWAGVNISEREMISWDFPVKQFTLNGVKNKKHSVIITYMHAVYKCRMGQRDLPH